MLPFDECPVCAGHIVEKEVTEKIVSRGKTTILKLPAYVCCKCSERFYSLDSMKYIEKVRAKLES